MNDSSEPNLFCFYDALQVSVKPTTTVDVVESLLLNNVVLYSSNRGKILGIRSPRYQSGSIIPIGDISGLPSTASYYVWLVAQVHEEKSSDELLQVVNNLQQRLDQIHPLSSDVLGKVLRKWKVDLVFSTNCIEGNAYTFSETYYAIAKAVSASFKPLEDGLQAMDGGASVEHLRILVANNRMQPLITESELLELHAIVVAHTLKDHVLKGQYRNCHIVVTGCPYEFPAPDLVPSLMRDFVAWVNDPARDALHAVTLATEAHLRFVTIHPFADGNGRMARLITNLLLMKKRFAPVIIAHQCAAAYMGFVRHYQVTKMKHDAAAMMAAAEGRENTLPVRLLVNEEMAALERRR